MSDVNYSSGFGGALSAIKAGHTVYRRGWNGKGMFLFLVHGNEQIGCTPPPLGQQYHYQPHIVMKTAQDDIVPWLASVTDILAEDWIVSAHAFVPNHGTVMASE